MNRLPLSLLLGVVSIAALAWGGCQRSRPAMEGLLAQVFLSDSSDFRGVNLGDDIQDVRSNAAPLQPRYQDRYGLSFEYGLEPAGKLVVDFFADNLITGLESNRIASIVAEIQLNDEVEAARLYQDIREYLTRRYNMGTGVYGDFSWSSATRDFGNMEVRLRLDESKRGIVINFVDTQAGKHAETPAGASEQ